MKYYEKCGLKKFNFWDLNSFFKRNPSIKPFFLYSKFISEALIILLVGFIKPKTLYKCVVIFKLFFGISAKFKKYHQKQDQEEEKKNE